MAGPTNQSGPAIVQALVLTRRLMRIDPWWLPREDASPAKPVAKTSVLPPTRVSAQSGAARKCSGPCTSIHKAKFGPDLNEGARGSSAKSRGLEHALRLKLQECRGKIARRR